MSFLKKCAAFLLAGVMTLSCAACAADTTWIMKKGELEMPAGVYLNNLMQSYFEATMEVEDPSKDVLKQTIDGKDASEWIKEQALNATKESMALCDKFNQLGLSFSEQELATCQTQAKSYYEQSGDNLEKNGISQNSIELLYQITYMKTKVFDAIYGEGGEQEVSEQEMRDYYNENYIKMAVQTFSFPAEPQLTEDMSEEEKQIVIEKLGLNKSMPEQYWEWLKEALKGNFGVSLSYKTPVAPMLLKRLPSTILLMGCSLLVSLALSIPLGLIAGYKKNTWIDNLISGFAYFGMSIPSFYFGMLMIILFTATLHILPSSGMHTVGVDTPLDTLKHMIMPVMTMALSTMASKTRYVRANTIGQLSEEYVLAAKAKGTSSWKILRKHVLKNTLLPIITIIGMNMASLVCGSFIIESVFGWPGVGSFAMEAIGKRDYPIIMAYVMLSGFILVIGNFAADILYSFADPRIKRGIDTANGK